MDGVLETLHGQQPQSQLDNDLMLNGDEVNQSDATQSQSDHMLLDEDSNSQQDNLTFDDFEHEIPHYLPEKALTTCSSSLLHADGNHETYLTIQNAPSDNYVAQKINDGHEIAIGGDPSHILKSLDREFRFQPQQRWHVIVISENTLQLTGVPRQSYPLISGMGDGSFSSEGEGDGPQQHREGGDILMNNGPVNSFRTFPGQAQQNDSYIDITMSAATKEPTSHISNHQETQSPPSYNFPRIPSTSCHETPAQDRPSQLTASPEHNKRKQSYQQPMCLAEEEEKQKSEDALIIAADHRFGHYVGTNLCRWCERRGHEAVQCIKWDPEHFDKLVCIACNNKKHLLDDCLRFQVMSEERRVKLLLVDGANRPGARSFFWPWVRVFATSFWIYQITLVLVSAR